MLFTDHLNLAPISSFSLDFGERIVQLSNKEMNQLIPYFRTVLQNFFLGKQYNTLVDMG